MEVKILSLEKEKLKLEIRGEDHTILNHLVNKLLEDETVEIAKYNTPHPLTSEPVLDIVAKDPLKSLTETCRRASDEIESLLEQVEKQLSG